jgi:predicted metal-dependent phosphotriesterase family hydrolase
MAEKRKPPIRQRPIQVKFFVDEKELDLIKQKMAQMGTENMSAYLRKMAIDGYVVNLDMPELRELTSKMKRISNSENQIAKRLNETGNIYEADIVEIKVLLKNLWVKKEVLLKNLWVKKEKKRVKNKA